MSLTDAELEAIALKEYPTAEVVAIDGRALRPTLDEMVAKWSNPQHLQRYAEPSAEQPAQSVAAVLVRRRQQNPPIPESLRHQTLLIDRASGQVIALSG